jgi:LuxR family transcriptional regulator, maltose regulon positive regulatory protein
VAANASEEEYERPGRSSSATVQWHAARLDADHSVLDVPIETKLHAPGARPDWVERPELVQRLAATTAKLVLVEAPAGFGKTTLVAQWRSAPIERRTFAWLSLDRGDDDPVRLWWHVVSSLQRACPDLGGQDMLDELRAQVSDITRTVVPMLVNAWAALPDPVVLVLDDYHVISAPDCHEQIAALLLHLPSSAQMVLITRSDPPLPLARMRAGGDLAEIRMRELRFTPPEAAALVRTASDIELSPPDVADLVARADGWAAGIYLAALSLRSHPSPTDFVRNFTGDNRFIVDFLAEEVLSRQPAEIRRFLTRTAILTRFCAPLCDAVIGSSDAAAIIDVLERENLFVVPLDDSREWYRYHHLFAQVLRAELVTTEPELIPTLHQRACAWHRARGVVGDAVTHALAAGNTAEAVDLIARHWHGYVNAGRVRTVRGWLDSLTDDQIAAYPLAAHCGAWAAALSGEPDQVHRWLPVIEAGHHEGPLPDGLQSLDSSAALLRGVYGFDGLRVMRESAREAAKLENDPGSAWSMLAQATLGFSMYLSGDFPGAAAALEEAVASPASRTIIGVLAFSVLSLVMLDMGQLPRAQDLADTAIDLASHGELRDLPQCSVAYAAAGAVHAAHGLLEEGRTELQHALRCRRAVPKISPWATLEATLLLARVELDLGDVAAASELIAEANDVLTLFPDGTSFLQAQLARLRRRLAALQTANRTDRLTERELAVLRLLPGTLSLREIAEELYVSLNTVKTHVQAIYRKLGVSTRDEAVSRGRDIGIL